VTRSSCGEPGDRQKSVPMMLWTKMMMITGFTDQSVMELEPMKVQFYPLMLAERRMNVDEDHSANSRANDRAITVALNLFATRLLRYHPKALEVIERIETEIAQRQREHTEAHIRIRNQRTQRRFGSRVNRGLTRRKNVDYIRASIRYSKRGSFTALVRKASAKPSAAGDGEGFPSPRSRRAR
jgi:hypothetical protein